MPLLRQRSGSEAAVREPPSSDAAARPVVLATLSVRIDPEAERMAIDSALDTRAPLIIANMLWLPPHPTTLTLAREVAVLPHEEDLEAVRETAARAAARGVRVELLRISSRRPLAALLELIEERGAGLVVLGPDPERTPRWWRAVAARRIRRRAGCLVWIAPGDQTRVAVSGLNLSGSAGLQHSMDRPDFDRFVAAAAAAGVTAVLALAGGASTAFAGWTPQPTTPTPAQLAAATAYCAGHVPDPGLPLTLAEARGPFTVLIYSNGATDNFCTVGPSFRNASGWTSSPSVTPPSGQLFLWADHTATGDDGPQGWMIAQAGADVSAADVTLDDGSVVRATVQNGWAVAWWPRAHHLASARLTTPAGVQTQAFAKSPCDVDNCQGGPHGGAPGGGPGGG